MNLTLRRKEKRAAGIFSELLNDAGNVIAATLEHAYEDGNGGWEPKIPLGTYNCVRGPHRLHNMTADFTTFEITGVEGHSNLLFHWGNFDRDSEGCILLGEAEVGDMVTNSRVTFAKFMTLVGELETFELEVI